MAKRKKTVESSISVHEGSGNVFADLGLEDAEELQVKSGLTLQLYNRIKELGLTQARAAALLEISQPDVSKLMRARYTGFSIERLMHLLNKLSVDVHILLKVRKKASKGRGTISLVNSSEETRSA